MGTARLAHWGRISPHARTRARAMMYQDTRMSLVIQGEYVAEVDMNPTGERRWIAAIGSVVTVCALVLSGCGGSGGDDGTNTDTNGTTDTDTTDTSTGATDDTTTPTQPSTTATTIEYSP